MEVGCQGGGKVPPFWVSVPRSTALCRMILEMAEGRDGAEGDAGFCFFLY